MEPERLSTLTKDQFERLAITDAVRLLSIAATTGGGSWRAAETFAIRYPRAVSLAWVQKAIAPASTLDPVNAGALLPPALLDPLVARIKRESILARIPGIVSVPLNVPVAVATAAPTIAWVAQGAPKPVSQLALADVVLAPYKGSGIVTCSKELATLTAAGAEGVIENLLVNASTRFVDKQFLDPSVTAVATKNPASITAGVTPVAATGTLAGDVAALVSAFYTQRPQAIAPVFVLSPTSAAKIAAAGQHPDVVVTGTGTLQGTPAVVTPGAGTALVLLDAAGVVVHDGGAEVDVSRQAAIEMEAAPASPPVAATVLVDLWSRNLVGFRLDRFCSWMAEPSAVAYVVVA